MHYIANAEYQLRRHCISTHSLFWSFLLKSNHAPLDELTHIQVQEPSNRPLMSRELLSQAFTIHECVMECFGIARISILVNIAGLKIPPGAESAGYMPEYRQASVPC